MDQPTDTHNSQQAQSQPASAAEQLPAQLPKHISLDKWADSGFYWSGKMSTQQLPRLQPLLSEQAVTGDLTVSCRLFHHNQLLWLHMSASAEIFLTCQRCLQPMQMMLDTDKQLAILPDESVLSLLDDDSDYLFVTEVCYVSGAQQMLPLLSLIEDEILLDVPLSPKHAHCDMVVSQAGVAIDEQEDNPFAALAALKGRLTS